MSRHVVGPSILTLSYDFSLGPALSYDSSLRGVAGGLRIRVMAVQSQSHPVLNILYLTSRPGGYGGRETDELVMSVTLLMYIKNVGIT